MECHSWIVVWWFFAVDGRPICWVDLCRRWGGTKRRRRRQVQLLEGQTLKETSIFLEGQTLKSWRRNQKSQTLGGSNFEVLLFPDAPESWKRELVRRRNRKSQTLGGSSFERGLYPLGGPNCKQERPISWCSWILEEGACQVKMLGEETKKMDSRSFVQLAETEAHLYNPNPQERSVYGGVQCTMYNVQCTECMPQYLYVWIWKPCYLSILMWPCDTRVFVQLEVWASTKW